MSICIHDNNKPFKPQFTSRLGELGVLTCDLDEAENFCIIYLLNLRINMNDIEVKIYKDKIECSCNEYGFATFCIIKEGDSETFSELNSYAIFVSNESDLMEFFFTEELIGRLRKYEDPLHIPGNPSKKLSRKSRDIYRKAIRDVIMNPGGS